MAGRIAERLAELGIELPEPTVPIANYVPFVGWGGLVVVSGQVPMQGGKMAITGKMGTGELGAGGLSVEQGQAAARMCFVNLLAQLRVACGGDLDRVQQVVRLGGFIAAPADFTAHAVVMNGASDLAVAVFGQAGRHARSTVGVPSLPSDAPVEVEGMFAVSP